MPTISVTIPAKDMQRVTDAFLAETGLEPKEALIAYVKTIVVGFEFKSKEKDIVETVLEAKKKIPIPPEPNIS